MSSPSPTLFAEAVTHSGIPGDFLGSVIQSSTEYSIIAKDLRGNIILWNEGARRLYGYEPHEVIGNPADILHAPEDIALGLPDRMREVALRDGRWEGTISRITKDQLRITVRLVMTPHYDNNNVQGFVLISKDVTKEYRLRERIDRTRLLDINSFGTSAEDILEFLITMLEASTEYSIVALDLVGGIVLWNEGARLLYGYEPYEVVGKANFAILFRDADRAAGLPREILEDAARSRMWSGDVARVTRKGNVFTAHVVVTARRDASHTLRGYLLISHPAHAK